MRPSRVRPETARRRVAVSGVPGSGKSTLGREVARRLDLAFLDKDDYLEALFESEPSTESRSVLSRRADDQRRDTTTLLDQATALAELGPLGVGRLVRVETDKHVDLDAVVAAIEAP